MIAESGWLSAYEAERMSRHILGDFGLALEPEEIVKLGSEEALMQHIDALVRQGKAEVSWDLSADETVLLRDHRVGGRPVYPTDGYLELLAQSSGADGAIYIERLHLAQPLAVDPGGRVKLELTRESSEAGDRFQFRVGETVHASALVRPWSGESAGCARHWAVLDQAQTRLSAAEIYGHGNSAFGPFYQSIQEIRVHGDSSVAWLRMKNSAVEQSSDYLTAPALLDAALVTALSAARLRAGPDAGVYLPVLLEEVRIAVPIKVREAHALVELVEADGEGPVFRVSLIDAENRVLFLCERMHTREFRPEQLGESAAVTADEEAVSNFEVVTPDEKLLNNGFAIVGMSCRFPRADSLEEYWENIREGRDCITQVPSDRWNADDVYDPDPAKPGKSYSKVGGFLRSVDQFDPLFFGIAGAEAELMDPQQRLFLTEAWKALEDAGYSEAGLSGQRCGVFAGASTGDYMQLLDTAQSRTSEAFTGLASAILASRVSYYLNLTGPCLSIDTACSSSLVAVRQAIASIESGDCDMALAGGIALMLTPDLHIKACKTGMLSPRGHCRSFDAAADGIVLGEGVGLVVIKPVDAARRDGDRIYAVICGSGSNQDGRTNGITAPSGAAQQRLIREVHERAEIDPRSIGLIEAHGTGTTLGDAVELDALLSVFPSSDDGRAYCSLSSVKSQIGHTTLAAGVAGLIKAALCIYNRTLPPTLHFESSSEAGQLDGTPFRIDSAARPWDSNKLRRAAVSSFGFSGTNCHVVLEEVAVHAIRSMPARTFELIALSAKTPKALARKRQDLVAWLNRRDPETPLYAAASTLAQGRSHFRHRAAWAATSWEDLSRQLAGDERVDQTSDPMAASREAYLAGDTEALLSHYPREHRRILTMPSYPFSSKRYWLTAAEPEVPLLHPFASIERNDGTARYTLRFTGREDFFAMHRVAGEVVMPGVCLLEFARAAASDFLERPAAGLDKVRWLEQVKSANGAVLTIDLRMDGEGAAFTISQQETVRCSGSARTTSASARPESATVREFIDGTLHEISGADFYGYAEQRGLALGPLYRSLRKLHYLAAARAGRIEAIPGIGVLAPGWMDGALQTALAETDRQTEGLRLPSSLEQLEIFGPLPERGWARAENSGEGSDAYDSTIYDDDGVVAIAMRGFRARDVSAAAITVRANTAATFSAELIFATEEWEVAVLQEGSRETPPLLVFGEESWDGQPTVLPGRSFERISEDVWRMDFSAPEHYRRLLRELTEAGRDSEGVIHDYRAGRPARELFLWTQALLKSFPRAACRVIHRGDGSPASGAVAGLARTIALETPRIRLSVVEGASRDQLLDEIRCPGPLDVEVCYRGNQRLCRRLKERQPSTIPAASLSESALQLGGVYLISGGSGRIAQRLASWLVRRWEGRIALLSRTGGESSENLLHLAADVTSVHEVREAVSQIHERWGGIDGVFHLAGIRHDALLTNLPVSDFDAIMAPKIGGLLALDEVLRAEPLRFFVAFSSIAAQFGNRGQSAYAAANRYMDCWCAWREGERAAGRRSGISRSINWPLWAEGSMVADLESQKAAQAAGFVPMPTDAAGTALEAALAGEAAVMKVLYGDRPKLQRLLAPPVERASSSAPQSNHAKPIDASRLASLVAEVTQIASDLLKVEAAELDPEANLGDFGFHSINITGLANQLRQQYGVDITPATLFEYSTLDAIAGYLSNIVVEDAGTRGAYTNHAASAEGLDGQFFASETADHSLIREGNDPVAIVGFSGRMPRSADLGEFWNHLREGRSCTSEIPADRWDWRDFAGEAADGSNRTNIRWGAFLSQVDQFDPLFFGISPKEAASMDPQQRLMLECAWEAIEDSGTAPRDLAGTDTGVFVGVSTSDYADRMKERGDGMATHGSTGTAHSLLPNRISYLLDLHGPSEPVDTACSSTLVAMHRGVEAILAGRCDAALAGGVNVMLSPTLFISFAQAGMLSPDGVCRPFDEGANGYVRGEGAGMFLLKRLSAALKDGNPIHGVIRSVVVNHGGRATSLTAPNPNAQAALLREALREAKMDAGRFGYIEAHGTGTPLGDPIEVNALRKALGQEGAHPKCWIGSGKGNTGHMEAAAGCASLIKVLFAMRHREIPPSVNVRRLNPQLRLEGSRFGIITELREWTTGVSASGREIPRVAGISSFGFGGANAHMILEEFIPENAKRPAESKRPDTQDSNGQWIVLSARDEARLRLTASRLAVALDGSTASLIEIAWTLQSGRDAETERLAFLAQDLASASRILSAIGSGKWPAGVFHGTASKKASPAGGSFVSAGEEWVTGAVVDWGQSHSVQPARVSIPGSAFLRQRCWFAEAAQPRSSVVIPRREASEELGNLASRATVVLEPVWQTAPLAHASQWTSRITLVDATEQDHAAWERTPGARIEARTGRQVEEWLREIAGAEDSGPETFVLLHSSFDSWRSIAASAARAGHRGMHWLLVSRIAGGDLNFEMSHGVGRALVEASPRSAFVSLRLAGVAKDEEIDWCRKELAAALPGTVREVRIANGERHVRGFRIHRPGTESQFRFRADGVYLVSGGLGSLGSAVARRMTRAGASVGLLGRSEPDGQRAQLLADLKKSGNVDYYRADAASPRQLAAALREVRQRQGPIHGVIHAAGVLGAAKLAAKLEGEWESVLSAKVDAALALDAATAQDPLDFFVMYSSLASALGDMGRGDYAAANRFLDAFAAQRALRGPGKTLSVGWGLWRNSGLTAKDDVLAWENATGLKALDTESALDTLEMLFGSGLTHALVTAGDLSRILRLDANEAQTRVTEPVPRIRTAQGNVSAQARNTIQPLEFAQLETEISELVHRLLQVPAGTLHAEARLQEYGLDSILINQLASQLEKSFGAVPKSVLLENDSIRGITEYVARSHPDRIELTPQYTTPAMEPIAIVGLAGRYPGAETLDELWSNLRVGKSAIGDLPSTRWPQVSDGDLHARRGGFLGGVDLFDPVFFGITPVEAESMKPEERLLLELAADAMETAGYTTGNAAVAGAGVYMGVTANTYSLLPQDAPDTSLFGLANRVSHAIGCTGPSLTLDTGCCSALAAIHLACEALRSGSIPMAVVGAINLFLHPGKMRLLETSGLVSAKEQDGLYAAGAKGFVPGEGGGVVVLTTLSRARANKDCIWGVIEGTALSHQGGNRNYRLPSPQASREHLARLLEKSQIDGSQINYVELQALGAELADASEWSALTATLGDGDEPCPVGSGKLGMGHLEAASGIAQLTKVLLQMRHGETAPSPLSSNPNAEIAATRSRFFFTDRPMPWQPSDGKRRALIASSGVGGSLASLIVSQAEPEGQDSPLTSTESNTACLLLLSAQTAEQLRRRIYDLKEYLYNNAARPSLADVCYTLQRGRAHYRYRSAYLVLSHTDFLEGTAPNWEGRVASGPSGLTPSNMEDAAAAWVTGTAIPESFLARGGKVPLPTYPFERIRCWLKEAGQPESGSNDEDAKPESIKEPKSVVADYYNRMAGTLAGEVKDHDIHLIFAPFRKPVAGFSWLRTFIEPDRHRAHYELMLEAQRELKEALFEGILWNKTRNLLDMGCGFSTDLISLAKAHPQLRATGYTITPKQAELGRQRVAAAGLDDRVEVFLRDSSKDEFPGQFDAALAFEVLFHIENKAAVFANLARHLRPGGILVIADCLANTVASVNRDQVGLYTCRPEELSAMLAASGFEISVAIDAGQEMSHFLADGQFEDTLTYLRSIHPGLAAAEPEHRAWHNCGKAFAMGLIRYVLLTVRFDPLQEVEKLRSLNIARLASTQRYSDAIDPRGTARPARKEIGWNGNSAVTREDIGSRRVATDDLRRLAAEVIGIPAARIEEDIPLAEFGVDSLVGLKLLDTFNRRYGVVLPMQTLFDCPTLMAMRNRIESELPVVKPVEAVPPAIGAQEFGGVAAAMKHEPVETTRDPLTAHAIAIVGMAGRFPGARNVDVFWENILAGKNSVTEIPTGRWDVSKFYDPDPNQPGRSYSKWGGFLDGVDEFDAGFFRITRAEAEVMDPQQRLFLETCWEALEHAGYAGPALKGARCGVVAGVFNNDYQMMLAKAADARNRGHAMLGNANSILAARVSYFLNLKGPALSIDSACSSSLVAVHLACQSLRSGEADVMLAGGVTLYLDETPFLMMSKSGMLSPTGRCRSFSAEADGIAVGEAVGVVVLKRLEEAIADRDTIHGVIRGSGVNQDGQTNGITAPSSESQRSLLSSVYRKYGVDPASIGYVEGHGTGTKLGDPVEMAALTAAFREHTDHAGFCALGSVKSNIGHTSAAAGVTGLIKTALMLKQGIIPPSPDAETPNALLKLEGSPFWIARRAQAWNGQRRAAVSAFGFSGTNCHLVMDEAPPQPTGGPDCDSIVMLSAATQDQLREVVRRLRDWTGSHSSLRVCDIAWTLDQGRASLAERVQIRAANLKDLREKLLAFLDGRTAEGIFLGGGEPMQSSPADVRRVPLPAYPFARDRYWFRSAASSEPEPQLSVAPREIPKPRRWEIELRIEDEVSLREHKVFGRHSLPTDALLDIVYRHASTILGPGPLRIRDVALFTPLFAAPGEMRRLVVEATGTAQIQIAMSSAAADGSQGQRHLTAIVESELEAASAAATPPEIQPLATTTGANILRGGQALEVGEFFHSIREVSFWESRARARLSLSAPALREASRFALHPALLDSIFGLAHSLALQTSPNRELAYIPFCIEDVKVFASLRDTEYLADVRLVHRNEQYMRYDAELIDGQGNVAVAFRGLDHRKVTPAMFGVSVATETEAARPKLRLKGLAGPEREVKTAASETLPSEPVLIAARPHVEAAQGPPPERLLALLAEVMLCEAATLDPRRSLVEQGVDSILALEYVQRINREFGLRLQGTILFEHPTLEGLAIALAGSLPVKASPAPQASIAANAEFPERTESIRDIEASLEAVADPIVTPRPGAPPSARSEHPQAGAGAIAVIGMAGRFPGANTVEELWSQLAANSYLIREVPADHWDYRPYYQPGTPGAMYCNRGGFLEGVDQFDPLFFNISPREAETMDPQLRLFLEVLWEAFEDAGCAGRIRGSRTGVYLGNCYNDYLDLMKQNAELDFQFAGSGNSNSMLSNRVSFCFDLTGPCMTLDTACSSSLVALHLASQALQRGECEMAIAGGVNLNLSPSKYLNFCAIGAFSQSGEIRPFSSHADGYLPGEAVAAVLLKPLNAALRDGDRIHGVLRGSSVRCAGRSAGPTVPNPRIETETMVGAWRASGVAPDTITYLEAHGTGTRIGDPLEVNAIKRAFAEFTGKTGFCYVGTVKANIGHTEAAAGLAGVIKTLLQFRHRTIAGMPGLLPLNSMIEAEGSPLIFERETRPWLAAEGVPLRAGVSSFGMGGTYAHVVLEEYVERALTPSPEVPQTIVISARTPEALQESARRLADHLDRNPEICLADVAHTLYFGREKMEETLTIRAASLRDAIRQLQDSGGRKSAMQHGDEPPRGGRLIALPSYPFQQERYWIAAPNPKSGREPSRLKPDWAAITDGEGASFHCAWGADDPLLDQHRVHGEACLPATASLLLAIEAASLLQPDCLWHIKDVVWKSPIGAGQLQLRINRHDEGWRWSLQNTEGLELVTGALKPGDASRPARLDPETRSAGRASKIAGDTLYESFKRAGIEYGPVFRKLQSLWVEDDAAFGEWQASPGTPEAAALDSALQTASALLRSNEGVPVVPWSVGRVTRFEPLKESGYCLVRKTGDKRFHATVTDRAGNVCIELNDFAVRPVPVAPCVGLGIYQWAWRPAEAPAANSQKPRPQVRSLIVASAPEAGFAADLNRLLPNAVLAHVGDSLADALGHFGSSGEIWFVGDAENSALAAERQAKSFHRLVRTLCDSGLAQSSLAIHVVAVGPYGAGLLALARSTANEFPRWTLHSVLSDLDSLSTTALQTLLAQAPLVAGEESALRQGRLWTRHLQAADLSEFNAIRTGSGPLRSSGTYLIAGGAQGLGYETAQWLAREYQAKLILLGRRALAGPIWKRLETLERAGGKALYVRADLCDAPSLDRALELGRAELGPIEGVIHSAMLLQDGLLASMVESEFAEPLGPKMSGLENLREALRNDPLAFALLYSSVQSLLGNAAQGSYACASAFADSYAEVWRKEASYPVKTINWSYWGSVGAVAVEEYRRRMHAVGVESIEPDDAFPIVRRLLASSSIDQLWAIKASDRFLRLLGLDPETRKKPAAVDRTPSLLGRSLALLKEGR